MTENKGYLQRYAMLSGTYLGGFWILKFILFPLGVTVPFFIFLFIGLTLCVPFVAYYYVRAYRNHVCNGSIGFLHAWIFTVFMYMFAALLASVAHYIYFRFVDQGFILNAYENLLNTFTDKTLPDMDKYIDSLKESLNVLRSLSPIDITMQLISKNVFYGTLLAIPTALMISTVNRK
ncbi:DUF4199 domain-containing protein [Bacteroides sp. UBA939]|uniref:DUF4199 domain-containing protein n=1 Tax=Bacteroides sp. UBA939 TaxID=1946092 RepID=UPI0025C22EE1|nr:DUF4199 domain-containing protein [Bacteroides sp. UBA939]